MGESAEVDTVRDALPIGTAIAGYDIRGIIGRGGFGITYRAFNPVTCKLAAIKEFFPAGLAWRDGQSRLTYSKKNAATIDWALGKFQQTTTALCGLEHPSIVKVLNYVPANDTGYMLMELLEGQTLEAWLRERPPPRVEQLRPIVEPIMSALSYVHGRGLIHRDVAPDNILITGGGRSVLIDFGSMSRDLSDAVQEASNGTFGQMKRNYTAPEQTQAKSWPTPAADVYSMGAILYRALSGVAPADAVERKDMRFEGKGDPFEPLSDRLPNGCPPHVAQAIDRALAYDAEARSATITSLGDALASTPDVLPEDVPETKKRSNGGALGFLLWPLKARLAAPLEPSQPRAGAGSEAKDNGQIVSKRKRILRFALVAVLAMIGIRLLSRTGSTPPPAPPAPAIQDDTSSNDADPSDTPSEKPVQHRRHRTHVRVPRN